MTLLGWSPVEGMNEIFSLEEAAKVFGFDRVTKAGGKFDWNKLKWVNSQYLHAMPVAELTDLLIPYWQEAGYSFDAVTDRSWLEQIVAVIGPSLETLADCVEMTHYLFNQDIAITEDAQKHLQQDGVIPALAAVQAALPAGPITEEQAKAIVDEVVKAQGVKKGLVMKSLRAGLTRSLQGPDLMQSWLLLSQKDWAKARLTQAIG
jgi:glutamyl-tRNA synthetase